MAIIPPGFAISFISSKRRGSCYIKTVSLFFLMTAKAEDVVSQGTANAR